jgi:hypothetical protein
VARWLTRACSRRSRLSRRLLAQAPRQPSSLLKLVLGMRENRVKTASHTILAVLMLGASAVADVEEAYRAPESELVRARQYVASRFGENLCAARVAVKSGCIMTTSEDGARQVTTGYAIAFGLRVSTADSAECEFLVTAERGGPYRTISGGDLPDCANHPELCEIAITEDSAKAIARAFGLQSANGKYRARLGIYEGFDGFAWRVGANTDKTGDNRLLLVNAHTGAVERDYVEHTCG